MAKQSCSCTRPLLRLQEWDNSTLRLLDVGNQSHSTLKTSSTSAWRTPSGTSWSGEDEGPSEKLHMVARNRQGNWGNREDLLGLSANAGWTYYRTCTSMGMTITSESILILPDLSSAGFFQLIVVDAHYRWLEMEKMDTTISTKTIEKLQSLFSRYGVPSQ